MKKTVLKSSICAFLTAVLLFPPSCIAVSAEGCPLLSARCAVLYQPDTDTFLVEKEADTKRPMASTTKIMTALAALSVLSPDELVCFPKEAVGIEGSSAYLQAGEVLTVRDLLYALLLQSANDAAVALAITADGDLSSFAARMNDMAKNMGLTKTHFTNPHGLHDEEHYTTARELAIITAVALDNTFIKEAAACKTYKCTTSHSEKVFVNHNKLLRYSQDAIGVKTGFTKNSGRCLVGAAEKNGLRLISVSLDAPNDWQDHLSMWEYGFAKLEKRKIVSAEEFQGKIPVFGANTSHITVTNKDDFFIILPKNSKEIRMFAHVLPFPTLPIREGEKLGELRFLLDGKSVGSIPLYATHGAEKLNYKKRLFK